MHSGLRLGQMHLSLHRRCLHHRLHPRLLRMVSVAEVEKRLLMKSQKEPAEHLGLMALSRTMQPVFHRHLLHLDRLWQQEPTAWYTERKRIQQEEG